MGKIEGKRIAILAADGFEQSELLVPKQRLEEAGAKVDIISLKTGEIWGWQKRRLGRASSRRPDHRCGQHGRVRCARHPGRRDQSRSAARR